jgi:hypothetical protein
VAYIRFVHQDNLAASTENMPSMVKIEYENGYAILGMPDRYTMKILFWEFHILTEGWRLLPTPGHRRDVSGYVIHDTLTDWKKEKDLTDSDYILEIPPRIQEGQDEAQRSIFE